MTLTTRNGKTYQYLPVRKGDTVSSRYTGRLHEPLPSILYKHSTVSRETGKEAAKRRRKAHQQLKGIAAMQQLCGFRLGRAVEGWPNFPFDHTRELLENEQYLLHDLAQRASSGSEAAILQLKDWFHCHPSSIDTVACVNAFTTDAVVELLADKDDAAKQVLTDAIERQRTELLSMSESPLAVVATSHVISCWLCVSLCLARSASGVYAKNPTKGDDQISAAQRRMLNAIELFDRLVCKSEPPKEPPSDDH